MYNNYNFFLSFFIMRSFSGQNGTAAGVFIIIGKFCCIFKISEIFWGYVFHFIVMVVRLIINDSFSIPLFKLK